MQIEVETLSPDRTITYFSDRENGTYWGVELLTAPHGKAYYTVTHDGWVVYEITARELHDGVNGLSASEVFQTRRPSEPIPACVMSHLPKLNK